MIVLDTDVVSELMRVDPKLSLITRLATVDATEQSTTAITIGELAYGAIRVGKPELFERALHALSAIRILPFERQAGEKYGMVRTDLEQRGLRLADPDLRIASTVLVHGATLITGNLKHFQHIGGLAVEDWLRG